MVIEKVCGLCGQTYTLKPIELKFSDGCRTTFDSSRIHMCLLTPKAPHIYDYDICPRCTFKLHKIILDIQRNRPKKCEFCEFDRSPRVTKPSECINCHNFNNFRLKKRMHPRQA